MSLGFTIAIAAVPFLDMLDVEEDALSEQVRDANTDAAAVAAMDQTRRRLAQGVDAFVRSLPSLIRNDANSARAAAYALVGLVDERMLHHPAGGLDRWRDRLLEFELYGSALAGQEVVARAREAAYGSSFADAGAQAGAPTGVLAPLYLGIFRAGFAGSLRGDPVALTTLITSLEESVGAEVPGNQPVPTYVRPKRLPVAPPVLVVLGFAAWLVAGFAMWATLPHDLFRDAERVRDRVVLGLPATPTDVDPLERSIGPSGLPSLSPDDDDEAAEPAPESASEPRGSAPNPQRR